MSRNPLFIQDGYLSPAQLSAKTTTLEVKYYLPNEVDLQKLSNLMENALETLGNWYNQTNPANQKEHARILVAPDLKDIEGKVIMNRKMLLAHVDRNIELRLTALI